MKRISIFVAICCILIVGFTACRKYEEGPNLSLRTAKARLAGNWGYESALINGVDVSKNSYYASQKHYIFTNGDYRVTILDPISLEARTLQGTWKLYDKNKRVALTTKQYNNQFLDSTNDYTILKLYNKQLWLRSTDNNREFHLIPFE
jgi:hypothetical protein